MKEWILIVNIVLQPVEWPEHLSISQAESCEILKAAFSRQMLGMRGYGKQITQFKTECRPFPLEADE